MAPAKTPTRKSPSTRARTRGAAAATPAGSMTLQEAMGVLEKAGSAQTRKTYSRHGAAEPMFGTSFEVIKGLAKRIGADHDLALALWDTGNFDARNLAMKVADPARISAADLDRWARETGVRMVCGYIAMLAEESPRAEATAARWLAAPPGPQRCAGWGLVGQMAARHESIPDGWFAGRLEEIERAIHAAPDAERHAMNMAVISIGGRSEALRKSALATAKRIGKLEVDHGDTACKTPDAGGYIEKMWTHAKAKGFPSPAAQERDREPPRLRC